MAADGVTIVTNDFRVLAGHAGANTATPTLSTLCRASVSNDARISPFAAVAYDGFSTITSDRMAIVAINRRITPLPASLNRWFAHASLQYLGHPMTENTDSAFGISLEQWGAAFRPGMHEFAASMFTFTPEGMEQVRIAFGNSGPYVDPQGTRRPVYTHAVTLTPHTAVELARLLLKHYAEPIGERSQSSAEV